ncbi:MAG: hypothetical protein DHS20C16_35650 [Phycisphaerae bacterium]|nr:MAG: hypothetical protein DHS20C16_35650 [Phycisphaerae bacterium]
MSIDSWAQAKQGTNLTESALPRIVVDETSANLGAVPIGQPFFHVFQIHNGGSKDLRLEFGKKSCGCTTSSTVDKPIEPGKYADVRVGYSPTSDERRGLGTHSFSVMLLTNDPDTPRLSLRIRAQISPPIAVSPTAIKFRHVRFGDVASAELRVSVLNSLWNPSDSLSLTSPNPSVRIIPRGIENDAGLRDFNYTIEVDTHLLDPHETPEIECVPSSKQIPSVRVPIHIEYEFPVSADRQVAHFGTVRFGTKKVLSIPLNTPLDFATIPLQITSDSPLIEAIVTESEGAKHQLELTIANTRPANEPVKAVVLIKDPHGEVVGRIPIVAYLKP